METLRQKQSRFTRMIGELIAIADSMGFELTFGESYRTNEQAEINALGPSGRALLITKLSQDTRLFDLVKAIRDNPSTANGIARSLHTQRLAQDFNIFKDGRLVTAEEIHPLGKAWEEMGGTWGGRFGDPSHFSLEHNGVK